MSAKQQNVAKVFQSASTGRLVGKWFLTDEGADKMPRQGVITAGVNPETVLVQFYEWTRGLPTEAKLATISEMMSWCFFESLDDLNEVSRPQQRKFYSEFNVSRNV